MSPTGSVALRWYDYGQVECVRRGAIYVGNLYLDEVIWYQELLIQYCQRRARVK
jgi:hypothetical protein